MGFASRGLWVMQTYGLWDALARHQVGGQAELWVITGYGLSQVWVQLWLVSVGTST